MEIVRAKIDHMDEVISLVETWAEEHPGFGHRAEKFADQFLQQINDGVLFFCREHGRAVGMLSGRVVEFHWRDLKSFVEDFLYIAPGYRGKGISELLIRAANSYAQDNGCKMFFMNLINFNEEALKHSTESMVKNGFSVYGTIVARQV